MIQFKHINKNFNDLRALASVNLEIKEGEIFGIIGPSGAGKSTLLRLINGLESFDSGNIIIDSQDISSLNKASLNALRQNIGIVFQSFNVLDHLSVHDNIALPLKIKGLKNPEKVKSLLQFVNLEDKEHAMPQTLSGGQKQRVAIARALVNDPKYLLCDEATSALDLKSSYDILQLLLKVNKTFNTTMVIVTHDLDVAKMVCDRVAILENGSVTDIITVNKHPSDTYENFASKAKEVLLK